MKKNLITLLITSQLLQWLFIIVPRPSDLGLTGWIVSGAVVGVSLFYFETILNKISDKHARLERRRRFKPQFIYKDGRWVDAPTKPAA